jgi:hypothetical protein
VTHDDGAITVTANKNTQDKKPALIISAGASVTLWLRSRNRSSLGLFSGCSVAMIMHCHL